ncbi:MAG TPA: NAD(P)H-dependent glycerol-3-phosphate dehydrogenase, partial [Acidimicrobiales bacterium]|nr:NAD(P)H-dependent glycerol-3-phosphate dehydrogenase [Acidimicrobiales bacterium]
MSVNAERPDDPGVAGLGGGAGAVRSLPISKVTVLGAGSWGTTVASLFAKKTNTILWARSESTAAEVDTMHTNSAYLGDRPLSESLKAYSNLEKATAGADLLVIAVPSHGFRSILEASRGFVGENTRVLSLAKGIEAGSLRRMTQIIEEILPGHSFGFLTGPNLASEVIDGQPTASVIASSDPKMSLEIQRILHSPTMLIYTNPDVIGCELAGALKNVIAIAAGMAEGLGFGDNSRAALITRGLAEMGRLGVAAGGRPLTFAGLAGLGDLVATCTSPRSRNHYVGRQLGLGR